MFNKFKSKSFPLLDNVIKYCRAGHVTDDNMAHALCVLDTKFYKPTHSEYVIVIASPLEQLLHERASFLLYTCIACLVCVFYRIT